jgi:hypothetical protein
MKQKKSFFLIEIRDVWESSLLRTAHVASHLPLFCASNVWPPFTAERNLPVSIPQRSVPNFFSSARTLAQYLVMRPFHEQSVKGMVCCKWSGFGELGLVCQLSLPPHGESSSSVASITSLIFQVSRLFIKSSRSLPCHQYNLNLHSTPSIPPLLLSRINNKSSLSKLQLCSPAIQQLGGFITGPKSREKEHLSSWK